MFDSFATNKCSTATPPNVDKSSFVCAGDGQPFSGPTQGGGVDAAGNFYDMSFEVVLTTDTPPRCSFNIPDEVTDAFFIKRRTGASTEEIVCVPRFTAVPGGTQTTDLLNIAIDSTNGVLYVAVQSSKPGFVNPHYGIVRISGLATLLDIIATFQPAAGTLSWVTPKHPEALPAADRFMVFGGSIDAASQMSVPVPLDCNVPIGGNPQPGDYLSILDSRPAPPLGEASYVIIGVEHQMEQRFGREQLGSTLVGRDPSVFVGCG